MLKYRTVIVLINNIKWMHLFHKSWQGGWVSKLIQASILDYWLGQVGKDPMPACERLRLWFGHSASIQDEIKSKFQSDLSNAFSGQYDAWEATARGRLALILLFDQYNRHINIGSPLAYQYDERAQIICLEGLNAGVDHELDLIERAFFYFPVLHAEDMGLQAQSVELYTELLTIGMQEARPLYETFHQFSLYHYDIIKRFSRFPHRNEVLKRVSTTEELAFLSQAQLSNDSN